MDGYDALVQEVLDLERGVIRRPSRHAGYVPGQPLNRKRALEQIGSFIADHFRGAKSRAIDIAGRTVGAASAPLSIAYGEQLFAKDKPKPKKASQSVSRTNSRSSSRRWKRTRKYSFKKKRMRRRTYKKPKANKRYKKYKKSKKGSGSTTTKVMDILNPVVSVSKELSSKFKLTVNNKHYLDLSQSTATFVQHMGGVSQVQNLLENCVIASAASAPAWDAFSTFAEYYLRSYTMVYEVTNLSNSPFFMRPVHWICTNDFNWTTDVGLLPMIDQYFLNTQNFPAEVGAGTNMMTTISNNHYASEQVLTSIFENVGLRRYLSKKIKFVRGKEILVPPQGQIVLKDTMKAPKYWRKLDQIYHTGAGDVEYLEFQKGLTRGFFLECVGETARGGLDGDPDDSISVALPGFVGLHKKVMFSAQKKLGRNRVHKVIARLDVPALNAFPVLFGSENNAAVPAG